MYYTIGGVLYHHGIQGQKWGKRNGPPYPLKPSDHSEAEKEAAGNGKKSGSAEDKSDKTKKQGIVIPVTLATYLALSAATFAVSGAVKTGKAIYGKVKEKQFKEEKEGNDIDKKTGLKLKKREMSDVEDVKRVNNDINKFRNKGSTSNCVRCTAAYELRRRGYEVSAAKAITGTDGEKFMKDLFGAKPAKGVPGYDKYPPGAAKEMLASKGMAFGAVKATREALSKEPKGSRGQMIVQWDLYSGHSYIYQISKEGKVEFLDAQTGKKLSKMASDNYLEHSCHISYQRLDNCKTINNKYLKEAVSEDDYSSTSKKKSGK